MKHFATLCVLALALTGCATRGLFESTYGSWVGARFEEFERAFGPARSITKDGDYLIYEYELKRYTPCKIFWTVDQRGVIIRWRHEGEGCVLSPLD